MPPLRPARRRDRPRPDDASPAASSARKSWNRSCSPRRSSPTSMPRKRSSRTTAERSSAWFRRSATARSIVLQPNGEKVKLSKEEIEEATRAKQSAMPEGLLNTLTLEEVADLFAYLTKPPGDAAQTVGAKRRRRPKSRPSQSRRTKPASIAARQCSSVGRGLHRSGRDLPGRPDVGPLALARRPNPGAPARHSLAAARRRLDARRPRSSSRPDRSPDRTGPAPRARLSSCPRAPSWPGSVTCAIAVRHVQLPTPGSHRLQLVDEVEIKHLVRASWRPARPPSAARCRGRR